MCPPYGGQHHRALHRARRGSRSDGFQRSAWPSPSSCCGYLPSYAFGGLRVRLLRFAGVASAPVRGIGGSLWVAGGLTPPVGCRSVDRCFVNDGCRFDTCASITPRGRRAPRPRRGACSSASHELGEAEHAQRGRIRRACRSRSSAASWVDARRRSWPSVTIGAGSIVAAGAVVDRTRSRAEHASSAACRLAPSQGPESPSSGRRACGSSTVARAWSWGSPGRRAAVAAASSGLGLGTAKALAAEGVAVAICSRDRARIDDAVGGDRARAASRSSATCRGAAGGDGVRRRRHRGARRRRHPRDERRRPAARQLRRPPTSTPIRRRIDLNLMSVVAMCKAAVPAMQERGWGRVVAITSLACASRCPT